MPGASLTTPVADPSCGAVDADDGFCARFDASANQCTVECSSVADCPCSGVGCTNQAECVDGACSLTRTCLVAPPGTCS
jgi:hypothetical protein